MSSDKIRHTDLEDEKCLYTDVGVELKLGILVPTSRLTALGDDQLKT
jgi:hypothetical protein